MTQIEKQTDAIRAELEALLGDGDRGFRPYVKMDEGTPRNKWSQLDNSRQWDAFFLWDFGARNDEIAPAARAPPPLWRWCRRQSFPAGRLPLLLAPAPAYRHPASYRSTNTRAIIHLPLIVPTDAAFAWAARRANGEGEAFAFDDTIEHEAWNDSDELRAVLIFDVWNPHLSEVERDMLDRFYSVADCERL
jgi:hypothetical protein